MYLHISFQKKSLLMRQYILTLPAWPCSLSEFLSTMWERDFGTTWTLNILSSLCINLYNILSCVMNLLRTVGRCNQLHMHLQYMSPCMSTLRFWEASKMSVVSMSLSLFVVVIGGSSLNRVFQNSYPLGS